MKKNQLLQTLLRHQCDFWRDIALNRVIETRTETRVTHILALDASAIVFAFKEGSSFVKQDKC